MNPDQIVTIILNVTFIGAFIAIFFFTYGKTIEENVVKKQSVFIATHLANDIKTFINKDTADNISSKLIPPNMDEADKKAKEINHTLLQQSIRIVLFSVIIGLSISYLISQKYNLNFIDLIKPNLIILLFVGTTYFLFLTFFGQNFISADPNFVRLHILLTLQNKFKKDSPITLTDVKILESISKNIDINTIQTKQTIPQIPTEIKNFLTK